MSEQAEKENQEKELLAIRNNIKNQITPRIAEITALLANLTALLEKESYQDAENDAAFDIMDAIREEQDAIEELLFNLRDTSR